MVCPRIKRKLLMLNCRGRLRLMRDESEGKQEVPYARPSGFIKESCFYSESSGKALKV
jgi:hypothetical protein